MYYIYGSFHAKTPKKKLTISDLAPILICQNLGHFTTNCQFSAQNIDFWAFYVTLKNFFSDVSWPVNFLKNRVTLTRFFSGVLRASENLKYVLESLINTLSNYIKRFWNYLSFCPNTGCFLKHVYFTYHL